MRTEDPNPDDDIRLHTISSEKERETVAETGVESGEAGLSRSSDEQTSIGARQRNYTSDQQQPDSLDDPLRSPSQLRCLTVTRVLRSIVFRIRRLSSWFCGLEPQDPEHAAQHKQRLQQITSLKQHSKAKLFLDINAVVIVLLGVFIYLYFSVQ